MQTVSVRPPHPAVLLISALDRLGTLRQLCPAAMIMWILIMTVIVDMSKVDVFPCNSFFPTDYR